jgi:hypothetical protein
MNPVDKYKKKNINFKKPFLNFKSYIQKNKGSFYQKLCYKTFFYHRFK